MAIIQWVNLEKDDDYLADADIDSKDRCGKLSITTAFAKGKVPLLYKVKVSPSGTDNVTYSEAEKNRNDNFKMTKGAVDLGTEAEVLIDDVIQLSAAGGNKYKLEAKDANGKVVESEEIEAKRKLYYQYMHMEDANGKVTSYPLSQLESHCLKNFVTLTKVSGTDKKIPFHKCINMGRGTRYSYSDFSTDVKAEYDLNAAQKKVGCVTVLSCAIASYKKIPKNITHIIGGAAKAECKIKPGIPLAGLSVVPSVVSLTVLSGTSFLWCDLNDDDDNSKVWFIDGAISFTPNASSTSPSALAAHSIPIERGSVSIGDTKIRPHGGRQVIDISAGPGLEAMLAETSGTIEFALEINKLSGFSGGFSIPGTGITTCCTQSWFKDKKATDSDVIWNHELGHRMGMVAYGDKPLATYPRPKLPDAPPNLYGEISDKNAPGYNSKGHQGPHCEKGSLSYDSAKKKWTGTPGCVLFGATSASGNSSPLDYCSDCTPIVRKLDLSF